MRNTNAAFLSAITYKWGRVVLSRTSVYFAIRQCFFLLLLFFCFFFFNFVKPKLFYQYLCESFRKQQLRGTLLNMYVFNLVDFTKLCRFLATFFWVLRNVAKNLHNFVKFTKLKTYIFSRGRLDCCFRKLS